MSHLTMKQYLCFDNTTKLYIILTSGSTHLGSNRFRIIGEVSQIVSAFHDSKVFKSPYNNATKE